MNYLKKIILINSLFPYQEVDIKGSLHIGGGNGSGKTSMLRAIAGFYTGELKNSPEDIHSYTHFLPKKNSWLIYEIQGSKGLFSVAMNRSLGSPSFYFINGDYEEEIFRQKSTAKTATKVLEGIKSRKLHHVGPMEEVAEYLSILYGTYQGKDKSDLRKYAISASEAMSFAPLLLDRLCLGQSLSFSYIKNLLFGLAGVSINPLDLEKISQGLKEFRKDQRDLLAFQSSETEARKVVEQFDRLLQIEEHELELVEELNRALPKHKQEGPQLKKTETSAQKALGDFSNDSETIIQEKQIGLKEFHYKAGELAYKISVAKQKESFYEREKITDLLSQYEKLRYKNLRLASLQALSKDEVKKEDILAREHLEARLLKEKELRLLQEETSRQVQAQAEQETAARERREVDLVVLKKIATRIDQKKQALDALYLKRSQIEGAAYFEKEIEVSQKLIFQKLEESLSFRLNLKLGETQLASLQKRRDTELSELETALVAQEKNFESALEVLEKEHESLASLIANSGRAFMGWLEKNYPNWQQSIGKILKDEVLLSPFLNPGIERINELFYGIQLDLSDLPESKLDLVALTRKKDVLSKEIELFKKEQVKLRKKTELQLANRGKYFRQKSREQKRKLQKDTYALQQLQVAIKKGEANISTYKQQAVQKRSALLLKLSYEEVAVKESLEKEIQEKEAVEKRIKEAEAKDQAALAIQKKRWRKEGDAQLTKIEKNWNSFLADWQKRKKAPAQKEASEQENFFGWESLQEMIRRYQADKRDYLDQAPFWEIEQTGISVQIENLEADLFLSYTDRNTLSKGLYQKWEEAHQAWQEWEATEIKWKELQDAENFGRIKALLQKEEAESDSPSSVNLLLQKLRFDQEERENCMQALEKNLRKFQAHYTADNSFGFAITCKGLDEVKESANTLKLFLEEEKAPDFEQAIHLKHAELILGITEESAAFTFDTENIEKRVESLNKILQESAFTSFSSDSRFALRASSKGIFQVLAQIRAFQIAHAQELGSNSLFNQGDKNRVNTKAYQLLVRLEETLSQYPKNSLSIPDAYELCLEDPEGHISYNFTNQSPGIRRFTDIALGISLVEQLLAGEEGSPQFHLLLDQLYEFDEQALEKIQEMALEANIKLITAAPKPSNSIHYDQVFQLKIEAKQKREIKELS